MASHTFGQSYTASKNCYAVIYNAAGNVFDFSDNTFKALASATTPSAAMTEQTAGGGGGQSRYVVTVNLALLVKTLEATSFSITFFERAGGSPAPLTDTAWLYDAAFSVQAAQIGSDALSVEICPVFVTTAGNEVRAIVTVNRNGQFVNMYSLSSSATATVTARKFGAGADMFSVGPVTVNSSGWFEITQASPGYLTDTGNIHTIVITCNGVSTTHVVPVAVFG